MSWIACSRKAKKESVREGRERGDQLILLNDFDFLNFESINQSINQSNSKFIIGIQCYKGDNATSKLMD